MEPKRSLSNRSAIAVELDTGVYRVGELLWIEFEITSHSSSLTKLDVLRKLIWPAIEGAITKAREEGKEVVYLGNQTQMKESGLLEGCLVFACTGDYEQIAKNEKT